MTRLAQAGFGFNNTTQAVEFDSITGTATPSTTSPHSGAFCGNCTAAGSLSAFGLRHSLTGINEVYSQAFVRPNTLPSATSTFYALGPTGSSGATALVLTCSTSGVIAGRYYVSGSTFNSFTTTGTLTTGVWNQVEVHWLAAGASISSYDIRLNGSSITTGTTTGLTSTAALQNYLSVGLNLSSETATGNFDFDDMVVNSSTGTWPGGLSVGYLFPSGDGGSHGYNTEGAVAGTANNWQHVTDSTSGGTGGPAQSTVYIQALNGNTAFHDIYTLTDTGLTSSATIDTVMFFGRATNQTGSTSNSVYKMEINANATQATQTGLLGNATTPTYRNSNNTAGVAMPGSKTMLLDPAGAAWTAANLDGMTIGIQQTTSTSANVLRINGVWVSYSYTPGSPPPPTTGDLTSFISSVY